MFRYSKKKKNEPGIYYTECHEHPSHISGIELPMIQLTKSEKDLVFTIIRKKISRSRNVMSSFHILKKYLKSNLAQCLHLTSFASVTQSEKDIEKLFFPPIKHHSLDSIVLKIKD